MDTKLVFLSLSVSRDIGVAHEYMLCAVAWAFFPIRQPASLCSEDKSNELAPLSRKTIRHEWLEKGFFDAFMTYSRKRARAREREREREREKCFVGLYCRGFATRLYDH
jgi:hypothetical protein